MHGVVMFTVIKREQALVRPRHARAMGDTHDHFLEGVPFVMHFYQRHSCSSWGLLIGRVRQHFASDRQMMEIAV
jgi:hypothetical protein